MTFFIFMILLICKTCECYSIRKSIILNRKSESALQKNWLIVKDADYKGRGLFCDVLQICKGTYIGEYVGEVLTLKDYRKRYQQGESIYTFIISDEEKTQRRELMYLDAHDVYKSNITRYINHDSIKPNLKYVITRKYHKGKLQKANVKFYSIQDIFYGEELLFDYGPKYDLDYGAKYAIDISKR